MTNSNLIGFLDLHNYLYETNVDLKSKTWIHRGGIAEIFISPSDSKQLEILVSFLYKEDIHFLLIGFTSNIYILNECNIPVVVSTIKCKAYTIDMEHKRIFCETGVGVINLSKHMIRLGIKGFEYLTGLPGTVGAALVNNSSCKDNSISQLLESARVILKDGTICTYTQEDFGFEFRGSIFKKGKIEGTIISAYLKVSLGDSYELQKIAEYNDLERERLLDGYSKNLGCTVNRCFINGRMSLLLKISIRIISLILRFFIISEEKKAEHMKRFICFITGFKSITPYVSSKNPVIFRWLDDGADHEFPRYLDFMRQVYKTDRIEIEIIK